MTAKKYAQAAIDRITEIDNKRIMERECFEETEQHILHLNMRPSERKSTATKLLKVEKFSKKLIDCLVESVEVYCGGNINTARKFSNLYSLINNKDGQAAKKDFDTESCLVLLLFSQYLGIV